MASTQSLRVWNLVVGPMLVAAAIVIIVLAVTQKSWCTCPPEAPRLVTCPGTGAIPLCPAGYRLSARPGSAIKCLANGPNKKPSIAPVCPTCPFGQAPKCPVGYTLVAVQDTGSNGGVSAHCVHLSDPGAPPVSYQCTPPAPNPNPNGRGGSGSGSGSGSSSSGSSSGSATSTNFVCPAGTHLQVATGKCEPNRSGGGSASGSSAGSSGTNVSLICPVGYYLDVLTNKCVADGSVFRA